MACTTTCPRLASRQAHCGACHRTFVAVTSFDLHRRGGVCNDPDTVGMEPNARGVWRVPMSAARRAQLASLR